MKIINPVTTKLVGVSFCIEFLSTDDDFKKSCKKSAFVYKNFHPPKITKFFPLPDFLLR